MSLPSCLFHLPANVPSSRPLAFGLGTSEDILKEREERQSQRRRCRGDRRLAPKKQKLEQRLQEGGHLHKSQTSEASPHYAARSGRVARQPKGTARAKPRPRTQRSGATRRFAAQVVPFCAFLPRAFLIFFDFFKKWFERKNLALVLESKTLLKSQTR